MRKPKFREIRQHYGVSSKEIADLAGVRLMCEYRAELDLPALSSFALQMLEALSLLPGKVFSLEAVEIVLVEDQVAERRTTRLEVVDMDTTELEVVLGDDLRRSSFQ